MFLYKLSLRARQARACVFTQGDPSQKRNDHENRTSLSFSLSRFSLTTFSFNTKKTHLIDYAKPFELRIYHGTTVCHPLQQPRGQRSVCYCSNRPVHRPTQLCDDVRFLVFSHRSVPYCFVVGLHGTLLVISLDIHINVGDVFCEEDHCGSSFFLLRLSSAFRRNGSRVVVVARSDVA